MPYGLTQRLALGLTSALFDLQESDGIFSSQGEDAYRQYQRDNQDKPLRQGNPLVEVILLSRNDSDTGLSEMNSIER